MKQFSLSAFLSNRYKLILVFFSLCGAAICWFAMSQHGAGVTPDSVNYISVARNMIRGLGVVNYAGEPMVWWPPFYSLILALVQLLLKTDTLFAAMVLNIVLFSLTIYFSGLLFFRYFSKFSPLAAIGSLLVVLSIALIPIYVMVWSETLFILFVVLFFIFSENYLQRRNFSSLVFLSFIVSLACLTRYIGIVLIFCGLVNIIFSESLPWKTKISHLLVFLSISCLPLLIWLIRNYLVVGSFTGPRMLSPYSYAQNLKAMVSQVISWYFPGAVKDFRFLAAVIFVLVGVLIGVDVLSSDKQMRSFLKSTLHYWVFITTYMLFLLITCRTSFWQLIDNRYMAPIFVPLTLLLLLTLARLTTFIGKRFSPKWVNGILLVVLLIGFVYPLERNFSFIKITHDDGRQFTHMRWQKNDVLLYIQEHPGEFSNCKIYSNGADVIYLWTGLASFLLPTERTGIEPDLTLSSLSGKWPMGERICLVQINDVKRDYLFTTDELLQLLDIEKTIDFKEGVIYFATNKE